MLPPRKRELKSTSAAIGLSDGEHQQDRVPKREPAQNVAHRPDLALAIEVAQHPPAGDKIDALSERVATEIQEAGAVIRKRRLRIGGAVVLGVVNIDMLHAVVAGHTGDEERQHPLEVDLQPPEQPLHTQRGAKLGLKDAGVDVGVVGDLLRQLRQEQHHGVADDDQIVDGCR